MNLKQKIALVAIPAALAIGAGMIAVQAAPSPTPPKPNSSTAAEPAEVAEPAGAAESTTETVEANEPPGGGHADPDGQNVDHQFEGVE